MNQHHTRRARGPGEDTVYLTLSSWLVLAMLSAAHTPPPARDMGSRLRCLDPAASHLVAAATAWSSSVRLLIGRVEQSDLIVFVKVETVGGRHDAETRFVSATPDTRYLMVRVDPHLGDNQMVVLFGHELQHVIEIADAPGARRGSDIAALFNQIGWLSEPPFGFETAAAVEMGRTVAREVHGVPATS